MLRGENMTSDEIILLVGGILFGLAVIIPIAYLIWKWPELKRKEQERKQAFYDECEKELDYVFKKAIVLEKRKDFYYVSNLNIPKSQEDFFATFLIENKEKREFQIREDIYERIEQGQQGTLITVNGNFFDFGDGEEVELEDGQIDCVEPESAEE